MKKVDSAPPAQCHVGMHLQGTARTDARVLREARALVGAGYAVTIVDTDPDITRPRVEMLDGVALHHVPKKQRRILPGKLGTAINVWKLLLGRIRALLALRADAYHAHVANTLLATYIASRIRHKPVILDAHELPYVEHYFRIRPIQRWLYTMLLGRMLPHCEAVITVSLPIAKELQQRYGGPRPVLVRNIPPYQEPGKSNRLREELALTPQTRIALYQGNLQEDRSLDVLVRAARYLPAGDVIVLMGNGESKPGLERLIAEEGVGERVLLVPAAPYAELLSWTVSADLGLILYTPETSHNVLYCLPNKLFEYLMAGLPVLSSQLPAVAEVLTRYEVGQGCPSLEPEVVAASIAAMLADEEGLAAMRRRALAASATDLKWENEQNALLTLYEGVLHTQPKEAISELAH